MGLPGRQSEHCLESPGCSQRALGHGPTSAPRGRVVNYTVVGNLQQKTGSYDVDCLDAWMDQGVPWDNNGDESNEANSINAEAVCLGANQ